MERRKNGGFCRASAHIIYNLNYSKSFSESNDNELIHLGKKLEIPIKGRGNEKDHNLLIENEKEEKSEVFSVFLI